MTIPDSMYYSAHYSYLVTPFVPGVDAVFRALEFIVKSNGHTVEATATVWEFDGWADPVVWYAGSETPSTISARFSGGMSRLSKVVWTGPAPSRQEVFSEEPEDETVFYTVPIGVAMCWKPGDQIIYRCAGTNERGETASVSVKIMVLEGTGPQTSASADGPWTDLDGRDWGQLRMDPLFAENGNQYYRCVVTNGDTGDSAYSNPYMVSAWSEAATPLVLGNPESQTFPILPENGGTTPGNTIALQSAAVLGSGVQTPEAQWQYRPATEAEWTDVPAAQFGTTIREPVTADGISTLKLDANFDSRAPSGEYRCLWTNGAQQLNAPLVPQSASMPAHVVIRDPDDPWVLTQPAADVVRVGEPAKYKVDARLGLGGTDEDVLVYIWQMSRDGGRTWQNCVAERDGTGQFTDTFTTVPVTGAMYAQLAAASAGDLQDSIFQYRCIVANRRLNNAVVSAAAPLVILPGTPEISPGPGSSLSVISFGDVRYLRGVTATAAGTTVDAMLHDLRYDAPVGYYVRVMIPHVGEVPAEDVFFTGMDVELVNAATNDVVDRVVAVVRGDVLGTGKLALSQLVRLARAYSGAEPLEGPFELAATVKGSGGAISLTDLVSAAALFQDSSK